MARYGVKFACRQIRNIGFHALTVASKVKAPPKAKVQPKATEPPKAKGKAWKGRAKAFQKVKAKATPRQAPPAPTCTATSRSASATCCARYNSSTHRRSTAPPDPRMASP